MALLSEMAFDLSTLCSMKLKKTRTVRVFYEGLKAQRECFGRDEKEVNAGLGVEPHSDSDVFNVLFTMKIL